MQDVKLCLGVGNYGISSEEQIRLFAETGFEGFFTGWKRGTDLKKFRRVADECGMLYQSVHAPFLNCAKLWTGGDEGEDAVRELIECLEAVSDVETNIMVCHAFIGFEDHTPTEVGLENYGRVFKRAEELGVTVALENTEGEEYLDALMKNFSDCRAVKFCLDTGHAMCYNGCRDWLSEYGERLAATHINDNLGVRDFGGRITFHDDLHLLPFDGVGDFGAFADSLVRANFEGPLTFELKKVSGNGRHDNDEYDKMSPQEYVAKAYARACRVGTLYLSAKRKNAAKTVISPQ